MVFSFEACATAGVAVLVEAAVGYPNWLFSAIGHPVTWVGGWISVLERWLNRGRWRVFRGGVVACLIVVVPVGVAVGVQALPFGGWVLEGVLASSLLAQRSLWTHVRAVSRMLRLGLGEGRAAVAMIVGRDPASLDSAGVARAAIESLAENFSDGVVAPLLWCVAFGLPGIVFYKAVNTADSMIGHRNARYEVFGKVAARLDDAINLPASRLSAVWLGVAACVLRGDVCGVWRSVWRDAGHHRSPNAGWPEAAMAGALGLRLAGPRVYGGVRVEDRWMGDGRAEVGAEDIDRALRLYGVACGVEAGVVLLLAVARWL